MAREEPKPKNAVALISFVGGVVPLSHISDSSLSEAQLTDGRVVPLPGGLRRETPLETLGVGQVVRDYCPRSLLLQQLPAPWRTLRERGCESVFAQTPPCASML